MSLENVELVTRAFEAINANGFEAALPFYATDVVIYTTPEWPGDSVYRGHDGARRLNAQFTAAFAEFGWDVREMRDVGDHVVALTEQVARIKGSGAPIRERSGIVVSGFRHGTASEVRFFTEWVHALESVGLSE